MSFFKKRTVPARVVGKPEYIVAGLGNPGREYEYSRHNTGFLALDVICNKYGGKTDRFKYHALTGLCDINGHVCLLVRPETYMNLSGNAVGEAAAFYKIAPDHVIVLYDDVSLPLGVLRIRKKGSAGGHNGVKSIIDCLGTEEFPRLKIGVGGKADPDEDLRDHVLGRFSKADLETIRATGERAAEAVALIVDGKTDEAMNRYNG
ncbi:MAG: aminoacyl-tRNA hydrolase [Clostridia bacterium]|nr:aminoacyl-tRNA hydrolase [Clostridia bacterium]